jgi:transcriptional regulator with PAS, ATPase and Fis domain
MGKVKDSTPQHAWVKEFPANIVVCDTQGIIIEMNDRAARFYEKDGGYGLVGKNVLDCHPEPARSKLAHFLETGEANIYTIDKKGVKKIIHQMPWYQQGKYAGIVEIIFEIPGELPHFIRE